MMKNDDLDLPILPEDIKQRPIAGKGYIGIVIYNRCGSREKERSFHDYG